MNDTFNKTQPPQPPRQNDAGGFHKNESPPDDYGYSPRDDYDYPNNYEPEKRSNAPMIVAIVAATVVVLAVMGFFAFIFFFNKDDNDSSAMVTTTAATTAPATEAPTTQPPTENAAARLLTMPDVVGLSEADAYKKLNEAGVKYRITRQYSDTVARGFVISQNPQADDELTRTDEATVYLSKGKENEIVESTTKPKNEKGTNSTEATKSTNSKADSDEYLLPDSDSKYLNKSDLTSLSREELNFALNEIFARHGRIFSDPSIKAYFNSQSWYHGTVSPSNFDTSVLNQYEQYNINLISGYQKELGYR